MNGALGLLLASALVAGLIAASVAVAVNPGEEVHACGEVAPPEEWYTGVYGVAREIDLAPFARLGRDEIAFVALELRAGTAGAYRDGRGAWDNELERLAARPYLLDVYMPAQDASRLQTGDCVLAYGPLGVIDCAGTCEPVTWFVDGIAAGLWADRLMIKRD